MINRPTAINLADGWAEVLVIGEGDDRIAVLESGAGYLRPAAAIEEEDRDLGDYFLLGDTAIRPAPDADKIAAARRMIGA